MCTLPLENPPSPVTVPHPGGHRAPALGSLHHTPNSHLLSIGNLYGHVYVSMLFSQILSYFQVPGTLNANDTKVNV